MTLTRIAVAALDSLGVRTRKDTVIEHALSHALTHSVMHSITTHSVTTHSVTHSDTHSVTHPVTHPLVLTITILCRQERSLQMLLQVSFDQSHCRSAEPGAWQII